MKKLVSVVSKWYQDVTISIVDFLAPKKDAMSLGYSFFLQQFCSPLSLQFG